MSQARRALRLRAEVPAEVPSTAMIMAAGLGKRMRPLTATRPKPLIEVNGKALLDHVLDRLRIAGVKKVVDVEKYYNTDRLRPHYQNFEHRPFFIL
jgi:MurNAc alpha-1-phosphate uridylyltransferase